MIRSNPTLRKKTISLVKKSSKGGEPGKRSARKAQFAVKKYKENGGGYSGGKPKGNKLIKWTKEKRGTKSGEQSKKTGERYLPEKARNALTSSQYKATSDAKRKGGGVGNYVRQPKKIILITKKYR